jgi:hypothetical protein
VPVIVNRPSADLHGGPSDDRYRSESVAAVSRSIVLRMRVGVNRSALTRELAEGADPSSSPEHALRARQLSSDRSRRQLARTLRRTIAEARKPQMTRSRVVIIRRGAVLEAEDALELMIARLGSSEPVCAKGMAIAMQIVTDTDRSPLYNPAEPGTLQRLVVVATTAMDRGDSSAHEFAIAA